MSINNNIIVNWLEIISLVEQKLAMTFILSIFKFK